MQTLHRKPICDDTKKVAVTTSMHKTVEQDYTLHRSPHGAGATQGRERFSLGVFYQDVVNEIKFFFRVGSFFITISTAAGETQRNA